jgi:hypothetical protein
MLSPLPPSGQSLSRRQLQVPARDGSCGHNGDPAAAPAAAPAPALQPSPGRWPPAADRPASASSPAGAAASKWGQTTPLFDPRSLVIGLPLGEGAFSHVYEGLWLRPSGAATDRAAADADAAGAEAAAAGPAPGGLTLALRGGGSRTPAPPLATPPLPGPADPCLPRTPPQGAEGLAADAAGSAASGAGAPPPVAVAVKVLKADRQGRCVDCYRLIREAQILARLSHK